jgi:hypothetical protein
VVVHAQVDGDVEGTAVAASLPDDVEGCGLLPATVAARRLRRRERVEQPLRKRLPGGLLERAR